MLCDICGAQAWYVCGHSGRPVCPRHSRIEIVSRLSFGSSDGLDIREATPADYKEIRKLAEHFRNDTLLNTEPVPYVVISKGHIAGVLNYSMDDDSLAITTLDVLPGYQGLGAGKMLLEAAKKKALQEDKSSITATAPNDDLPSIYFYQRNGFRIYDVKMNLIAERDGELRVGFGGIPSRDEIGLRWERDR